MIFVETPVFTEDVRRLLSDEEYSALQWHLVAHPDAGDLIVGTGGRQREARRYQGDLFPCVGALSDSDDFDLSERDEGRPDAR
jgi:hypothetical protein